MRKYHTRASVRYSPYAGEDCQDHGVTVFERDVSPQFTGLYDAHGNELWSVDEREPIGFRIK